MWFSIRYLLGCLYGLWRILLWLGLFVCVVIWVGIILFSKLPQYRSYLEQQLHLILEQPVTIGELSTYWVGRYPTLGIQKIRLLETHSQTPIAEIGYLELMLDLGASLRQRQLITRMIIASGCQFTIVRYPNGQLGLQGMKPPSTASSVFILGLPHEVLFQAKTLTWLEPQNPPLVLTQVELHLEKHQETYQVKGQTTLQHAETFQIKQLHFDSRLSFKEPMSFSGQWSLEKLHLTLKEGQLAFARLQGQIEAKLQSSKIWQIEAKHLLAWSSPSRPPIALPSIQIHKKNKNLKGEVQAFTFNTLKSFVQVTSSSGQEGLTAAQGQFHSLQWHYTTPHHWSVKTRFSKLSFPNNLATIQNASGQLTLAPQSGNLNFRDISVKLTLPEFYDHPLFFNTLHGKITWQHLKPAWKFSFENLQLQDANQLRFNVTGHVTLAKQQLLEHHIQVQLHQASLQQLHHYLPSSLSKNFELSTGQIHALQLWVSGKDMPQIKLQGRLEHVNLSFKDRLKVKNFSGILETSLEEGTLNLEQAEITATFPKIYSHPLSVNHLQGQLAWAYRENQWHLTLNQFQIHDQTLHLTANGSLHLPESNNSPYSDLVIELRGGQLAQISSYVPDQLRPHLFKWFQRAQLNGHLTQAKAILKGPLNQLFKDDPSGIFQFTAQVDQAKVTYTQGWPAVTHLQAQVAIEKRHMTITALRGQILNSRLKKLKVEIPDLASPHPFVEVVGSLQGNAADGIKFIAQSPLSRSVNLGERLDLKGKMTLQLYLKVPLSGHQPGEVRGKIKLKETTLQEKRLNLFVSNLHGNLTFDNHQIVAKKMQGKLWGTLPIDFSIHTLRNQRPIQTVVNLTGRITDTFLQKHLLPTSSLFSGQSAWQMRLTLPNEPKQHTHILLESDLSGMAIRLPSPLGKDAHQVKPLRIELRQSTATQIDLHYGDSARGMFQLHPTGLQQGLLQVGTLSSEAIKLPDQPGLTIEGSLQKFSLSEWQAILKNFKPASSSSKSPILFNANIEHLDLFGQTFEQVTLHAQHRLNTWQGAITGKNIEGQITYSPIHKDSSSDQGSSLDLAFNRLALTLPRHVLNKTTENKPQQSLNPHHLPLLSFQCNALQLGQFNLGQVILTTHKTQEGLNVLLHSYHDALKVFIQAQWQHFIEHPKTQLQIHLSNDTLDHMLQHFGVQNAPIEGARSQWVLDAHWSGSPMAFRLKNLTGNLNFLMTEGRIINIEPGLGRLLGLFDVWALPRRLNLDFSDVFEKGLGFTQAMGFLSIREGQVYTNNLMLQGTIAQIEVAGNTDLVARTYHQTVTVVPHISNTLPIAGTFAGGLGVGIITLVMQQILQKEIEKNIHYKYLITGKWDKPNIVSLPFK